VWQIDWLCDWLIEWLIDWLCDWLIVWLVDCVTGWLSDRLIMWLVDCVTGWLCDWLIAWLIKRVVDWAKGVSSGECSFLISSVYLPSARRWATQLFRLNRIIIVTINSVITVAGHRLTVTLWPHVSWLLVLLRSQGSYKYIPSTTFFF
jgi:hypothetical protein